MDTMYWVLALKVDSLPVFQEIVPRLIPAVEVEAVLSGVAPVTGVSILVIVIVEISVPLTHPTHPASRSTASRTGNIFQIFILNHPDTNQNCIDNSQSDKGCGSGSACSHILRCGKPFPGTDSCPDGCGKHAKNRNPSDNCESH